MKGIIGQKNENSKKKRAKKKDFLFLPENKISILGGERLEKSNLLSPL